MFKIAVVIFREFLEISILLGIVLAATREVKGRSSYIICGIFGGIVGASILALFASKLSSWFSGLGDEVCEVLIILSTIVIIGWTAIWMQSRSASRIKADIGLIASDIEKGLANKLMLTFIIAGTIFREGAEVVLFIYSFVTSQNVSANQCLIGVGIGAFGGATIGIGIYMGLIKFAGRYIFRVCFILLTFIAAGLAAQAAGTMTSVGIITSLTERAWDTSSFISDNSAVGELLKILIGYEAKPNIMQLVFYFSTLLILPLCSRINSARIAKNRNS